MSTRPVTPVILVNPTATDTAKTTTTTTSVLSPVQIVGVTIAGGAVFIALVFLWFKSQFAFNVVVNLSLVSVGLTVLLMVRSKQKCFSPAQMSAITYLSLYTIAIEACLIIMAGIVSRKANAQTNFWNIQRALEMPTGYDKRFMP